MVLCGIIKNNFIMVKGEVLQSGYESKNRLEPARLAVLISNKGSGTNLQAIMDAIDSGELNCEIGVVISDKADAFGLQRAVKHDPPIQTSIKPYMRQEMTREQYGKSLASDLNLQGINIAVMAGFMTVLPKEFFDEYQGKVINIHPGLIPDEKNDVFYFPDGSEAPWNRGKMTDDAVASFIGMKYAGSTIHIATPQTDFGPVLERVLVSVGPNDTVESLYNEKLKPAEHRGLISALNKLTVKK